MSHCTYCGIDEHSPEHNEEEHRLLKEQKDVNRLCNDVRAEAERVLTRAEVEAVCQAAVREATFPFNDSPFEVSTNWRVFAESLRHRTAAIVARRNGTNA